MTALAVPPLLTGARIRLAPFDMSRHLSDAYVSWLNTPSVTRYSEQRHRRHSRESCERFVQSMVDGPGALWAIEAADQNDAHIGNFTIAVDPNNRIGDLAILIGALEAQGRGYGLDAWRTALAWARGRPDLRKVTGGCMAANVAMERIMVRAGMRPDGRRPDHYWLDGRPTDLVYFAVEGAWTPGDRAA